MAWCDIKHFSDKGRYYRGSQFSSNPEKYTSDCLLSVRSNPHDGKEKIGQKSPYLRKFFIEKNKDYARLSVARQYAITCVKRAQ